MHSCVVHSLLKGPSMNSISRVWVLSVASALALSGCGGGDGPGPSDDSGLPPASACLPTAEVMSERIHGKSSYAETVEHMGCEGRLVSEANVAGQSTRTYDWGRVDSGPYVQMHFRNDLLQNWSSKGLYGTEPASCLPTRAAADRLLAGMDIEEVSGIVGCKGQTASYSVDYTGVMGVQTVLTWGSIESGPYLMVTVKDNELLAFSSQRL